MHTFIPSIHVETDNLYASERRRVIYHKPEVEAIWQKWLALPETEKSRTSFMEERRQVVEQINDVSIPPPVILKKLLSLLLVSIPIYATDGMRLGKHRGMKSYNKSSKPKSQRKFPQYLPYAHV